jgi:diguanylate cyclase (GGDEF)-like protein/PAS domain S-box-containing protein
MRRRVGLFFASLVVFVGASTLVECVLGGNLWIDRFLFDHTASTLATIFTGRLELATSTVFLAMGAALLLVGAKTARFHSPAQVFSLWAALVTMMAISGYLYDAAALYKIPLYTRIEPHVAATLFLMSGAIVFVRPRNGVAGELTRTGAGGSLSRRFLGAIFVMPVLLGWMRIEGSRFGFFGPPLGLALEAFVSTVFFAFLIWVSSRKSNRDQILTRNAEAAARERDVSIRAGVTDRIRAMEVRSGLLRDQATLLERAQDAIFVMEMDGRISYWNRGAEATYGWAGDEAVGRNAEELLKAEFPVSFAAIDAALITRSAWEGEVIHHTRHGAALNIASRWVLQRDASGAPLRILTTNNDISHQKAANSELQALAERSSLATAVAKVGVWEWDLASNMLTWDPTMFEIYGLPRVVPMPYATWAATVDREELPSVEAGLQSAIERKCEVSAEFRIFLMDGAMKNISAVARVVLDDGTSVTRLIGVNRDVTKQKEAERSLRDIHLRIKHSAQHDALTGLPNRILLDDRLDQSIARAVRYGRQIAVLFLDLDGFKLINDSLGHSVGDQLLQSVAARLLESVRTSDTVSRLGGDEFVVLLPELAQPEDAAFTAQRMLQSVARPHRAGTHDLHVRLSIGLSIFPDDGRDSQTLIKNADTAMYHAKEAGSQSYRFFKPALNDRAAERQSTAEGLKRAVDRNEFTLNYQPKVNLKSGKITGAEALLRWMHPDRGRLFPIDFISVAEDSGLMVPIGQWVLREACLQARSWAEQGFPAVSVSVNVSAAEFRAEGFLNGVFTILKETGMNAQSLTLEFAESVLTKHAGSLASALESLSASGIRIAVDDFGTANSGFGDLSKLPIDALKIHSSFVREITTAQDHGRFASAIVGIGKSMNLRVIAEGVESKREVEFLQLRKCDEAEGYFFSRPVPPEQLMGLFRSGRVGHPSFST